MDAMRLKNVSAHFLPESPRKKPFPRVRLRHLLLFALALFPLLSGFFFDLLEQIDIVAIRDLTVREEQGISMLDAVVTIRNSSGKTVKLQEGEFTFAVLAADGHDIPLGKAEQGEIVLDAGMDAAHPFEADIPMTLKLGASSSAQQLYDDLLSSAQLNLLEPTSKLPLHFTSHFRLAIKIGQAWNFSNWIDLDWTVTPEIERTVLIKFLQGISQGKFQAPPAEETKTPK